ncbi:MAG: SufB/SufD family protein [Vulcanimicrobiota bacterium]
MIKERKKMFDLFDTTGFSHNLLKDENTAHLVVHHNKVLGAHLVPGLHVDIKEMEDGIDAVLTLDEGSVIEKPVHICFGMLPEQGVQKINMNVDIGRNSKIGIYAHCTFPNAVDVKHIMDAKVHIGEGAEYHYFERHVHDKNGGVEVYPKAEVDVDKNAVFSTEFELLKGRVGLIDIDYETTCRAGSTMEMSARVNGTGDDVIKIKEIGHLVGEKATGVLTSRIAARDNTKAEVYNKMTASAPYARGHVDCKEIIQGNGTASAVPIVEVKHPKAHVTHEAAIGSVDSKELNTLMSRGLYEDQAVDLIIDGLLGK